MELQGSSQLNYIIEKAANISIQYNDSVIMPEHIFSAILSLDNFSLTEFLSLKGITNALISNYIFSNRKNFSGKEICLDQESLSLIHNAKIICKDDDATFSAEYIILALFKLGNEFSIVKYISNSVSNFDSRLIYKQIKDTLNLKYINQLSDEILNFGTNLNLEYMNGNLKTIVGRDNEIDKIIESLLNLSNPNCLIMGETGIGRTSIIYGLVKRICEGKIHEKLKNKIIFSLDMTKLTNNNHFNGESEKRIIKLVEICKLNPNIIILIDEINSLININTMELSESTQFLLKLLFSNTKTSLIGITNHKDYQLVIENNAELKSRFSIISVSPSTKEDTIAIIKTRKEQYFKHYNLKISDECINRIVILADKYIKNEYFPHKAISLTESSLSKYLIKYGTVKDNEKKLFQLNNDYENQKLLFDNESKLKIIEHQIEIANENIKRNDELDFNTIDTVLSERLNIPAKKLIFDDNEKFINLDEKLSKMIIGHDEIIKNICNCIKRNRQGYIENSKPIGSFLFLGPSGVGKTELARSLSKVLFGSETNFVKLDMSEYSEPSSTAKIIGAAPGLVGYNEGGYLVNKIKNIPYCVLLLDEIEKAHTDVIDLFLQVLDNGILTDSKNSVAYFSNVIIVMTSNCGISNLDMMGKENLLNLIKDSKYEEFMLNELKNNLRLEFINRFDEISIFKPITNPSYIAKILKLQIIKVIEKIKLKTNLDLRFTERSIQYLLSQTKCCDLVNGVRPLIRLIDRKVLDEILNEIVDKDLYGYNTIIFDYYEKVKIILK